jgi:hypothetical protein
MGDYRVVSRSMSNSRPRWVRFATTTALVATFHLTVLSSAPSIARADGKATATLIERGSDLFDDQQYEESIQTLSAALLRPTTDKPEKIEIYRLLAYNYIALKRMDEADAAVRGLFVIDGSFQLSSRESPRFRDFFAATRQKWIDEGRPGHADGPATPAGTPIKIDHASPAQVKPETVVKLSGEIRDDGGQVHGVELNYRTGASGKFITVASAYSMGAFRVQIPAAHVKPPLVEYYLQAIDKGGLPLTSRGDAASPLRIVVPAPQKGGGVLASPWFWVPVGVAVIGGVVATALLVSSSSGSPPGNGGGGGGGGGGGSGPGTAAVTVGIHE